MAFCGMKCTGLTTDFMKILDTCFSYNQKIKGEANLLCTISNIQSVLKLWKMRNLTLAGRIVIFPNPIISQLLSLQKTFIW